MIYILLFGTFCFRVGGAAWKRCHVTTRSGSSSCSLQVWVVLFSSVCSQPGDLLTDTESKGQCPVSHCWLTLSRTSAGVWTPVSCCPVDRRYSSAADSCFAHRITPPPRRISERALSIMNAVTTALLRHSCTGVLRAFIRSTASDQRLTTVMSWREKQTKRQQKQTGCG